MNKKITIILITILTMITLVTGCTKEIPINNDPISNNSNSDKSQPQNNDNSNDNSIDNSIDASEKDTIDNSDNSNITSKTPNINQLDIIIDNIDYSKIPKVTKVSSNMYNASFWSEKTDSPDKTLNTLENINNINSDNIDKLDFLVDIFSYNQSMDSKTVKSIIQSLSTIPTYSRYTSDGTLLTQSFYNNQLQNLNLENISGSIRYGITTNRTYLRTWPTFQKGYSKSSIGKFDRFLETSVYIAEPVAILHESKDGKWFFVSMYNYSGWLPVEDIATGDKEEIKSYANTNNYLLITGSKLYLSDEKKTQLDMGVRLALAEENISKSFDNNEKYIVKLPKSNSEGLLEYSYIAIDKDNDVSTTHLKYTKENILNQAFKFLGEDYGWGGENGNRDCSSFIMDIFRTFGILLPRNTGQQEQSEGIKTTISTLSTTEKQNIISSLEPGTVFYMNGHTMLYLGKVNGEYYIIHDVTTVYEEGTHTPINLNQVAITPLSVTSSSGTRYIDLLTEGVLYSTLQDDINQYEGNQNENKTEETIEKLLNKLNSEQVILVKGISNNSFKAKINLYEKKDGVWSLISSDIPAVLGKNGLGKTKEGDRKSPTGIFSLGTSFGFKENNKSKYPFYLISEDCYWVDDSNSEFYNDLVLYKDSYYKDWNSAESMSKTPLYEYGLAINYNLKDESNKGSAIFMHIFKNENSPTDGCTAVSKENIISILNWLDYSKHPLIVQGTQQDIEQLSEKPISQPFSLPEKFVYVEDIIPNIIIDSKYSTTDNFTGRQVKGYYDNTAILTEDAANALSNVQTDLNKLGYSLIIYDAYRPSQAVISFVEWASDENDTLAREEFYPNIDKNQLIPQGFIGSKSTHSRGSTVDLSIIDLHTNNELDMGGFFDFFGEISHFNYENLTSEQVENRTLLKNLMVKHGFIPYSGEWWHFRYSKEPFNETYFDFPVKW